ncbi:insecticidal delta-endotoxin Cry8Ea1 family protein [Methylosinus sp. 3S-1]|uniref:insecticidal delta-endotoxin Cry8Ea1 family protein n=1 Tax=Methylosinus sp. 3S-1 TaxID=1849840 RepID=UPI003F670FD2
MNDGGVFHQSGYEVALLPLFAQKANLHLTLLRDGVQMGFCDDSELTKQIGIYTSYAQQQIQAGLSARRQQNPNSFNYQNQFARFLQINVGNYLALWPYFDPKQYPPPVTDLPVSAEIFYTITETMGPEYASNDYAPLGALPGDVTDIQIYWLQDTEDDYNDIEGTQVDYQSGSQGYTGILVDGAPPQNGATDPHNSYFTYFIHSVGVTSNNPVTSVQGVYDTDGGTYCVDFVYADGSSTGQIPQQAGNSGYTANFTITPPAGYRLSSVWVPAKWGFYNMAQDMVFGFRLKPSSL